MSESPRRNPIVDLGIRSFGYALGTEQDVAATASNYSADPAKVLSWGVRTYHRADAATTSTDLAAAASRQALERAGVEAGELDLLVLANSELPEYSYWDGASALARDLGIARIQTQLIADGCAGGVGGPYHIAAAMAMQPAVRTALFVAVNRVSEFHRNRMNVMNTVLSDGAVAALWQRDHPELRWLTTEQFTDPTYCDLLRVDFGGAVNPAPPVDWSSLTAPSVTERVREKFGTSQRLAEFVRHRSGRLIEVIETACSRVGLATSDIDHMVYLNDSYASIAAIAGPLGLPLEKTNAGVARDHGHIGAADQFLYLGQHMEQGNMHPGDLVALCGVSSDRWCTTLIRV